MSISPELDKALTFLLGVLAMKLVPALIQRWKNNSERRSSNGLPKPDADWIRSMFGVIDEKELHPPEFWQRYVEGVAQHKAKGEIQPFKLLMEIVQTDLKKLEGHEERSGALMARIESQLSARQIK